MTKSQLKDVLWHGGKALLCSAQLLLLSLTSLGSIQSFISWLHLELLIHDQHKPYVALLHPLTAVILFVALWRYYDSIDDRSFRQFCQRCKERRDPPRLLSDPSYQIGLAVTVLAATPTLVLALCIPLAQMGLGTGPATAVSIALSVGITAGFSLLRIRRLEETWLVQKDLLITKFKLRSRILYAVIFFVSLWLLMAVGLGLLPTWFSIIYSVFRLLLRPAAPFVLALLLPLLAIGEIRLLLKRRKFMKRLATLQRKGELTYTVHGHPYLSALFPRVFFGLTIIDAPHADAKKQEYKAYDVGVISCRRRKGTVILCDNNVYRFMYSMTLRGVGGFRVGAGLLAGAQIVTVPAGAWYTNHSFDFPEGDGEKILLIDPAPRVLAIHGHRAEELIPQDNASKIYGYTVYGKNSFLNVLERT